MNITKLRLIKRKNGLKFIWLTVVINFMLTPVLSQVNYNSEIQPIFSNNCGNCHIGSSSGGLNLSSYDNLMSGGNNGDVIVPYDHGSSALHDRITRLENESGDMPPSGSLSQSEINLIAQWIDEGAGAQQGQGCDEGYTYFDALPENATNLNNDSIRNNNVTRKIIEPTTTELELHRKYFSAFGKAMVGGGTDKESEDGGCDAA